MQATTEIMIWHQMTKPNSEGNRIKVRIGNGSVENDYDAYMEEKNIVFKTKEKSYIINSNAKMEPKYS